MGLNCRACGNRVTPANNDHAFNEPIRGKPNPIIHCNVHDVDCGMMEALKN